MSGLIDIVFNTFGISSAPVTVSDFMWDCLVVAVGFSIVRCLLMLIVGLFKSISKA